MLGGPPSKSVMFSIESESTADVSTGLGSCGVANVALFSLVQPSLMARIAARQNLSPLRIREPMRLLRCKFPWMRQLIFCLFQEVRFSLGWARVVQSITAVTLPGHYWKMVLLETLQHILIRTYRLLDWKPTKGPSLRRQFAWMCLWLLLGCCKISCWRSAERQRNWMEVAVRLKAQSPFPSQTVSIVAESVASRSFYSLPTITESKASNPLWDCHDKQPCSSDQADDALGFLQTHFSEITGSDSRKTLTQLRSDARKKKYLQLSKWSREQRPNPILPCGSEEGG